MLFVGGVLGLAKRVPHPYGVNGKAAIQPLAEFAPITTVVFKGTMCEATIPIVDGIIKQGLQPINNYLRINK